MRQWNEWVHAGTRGPMTNVLLLCPSMLPCLQVPQPALEGGLMDFSWRPELELGELRGAMLGAAAAAAAATQPGEH